MHNLISNGRTRACAAAALLSALTCPAHAAGAAGGGAWLEGTPGSKFNKDDHALMMARVNEALKAEKDGETLEWRNEKTPASGSVTPLNRLTWEGLSCRRLRIANSYDSLKAQGVYKFCEKPAGQWKLVGPEKAPG